MVGRLWGFVGVDNLKPSTESALSEGFFLSLLSLWLTCHVLAGTPLLNWRHLPRRGFVVLR